MSESTRFGDSDTIVHVVDDEEAVRTSTCSLVGSLGLPTVASSSGDAFLERCHDDRPGCVLLDLRMPGTSGLEVVKTLKKRGSRLSVVVVTGDGDVETAVVAMQFGATAFLEKPYEPEQLFAAVEQAIAISKAREPEDLWTVLASSRSSRHCASRTKRD